MCQSYEGGLQEPPTYEKQGCQCRGKKSISIYEKEGCHRSVNARVGQHFHDIVWGSKHLGLFCGKL